MSADAPSFFRFMGIRSLSLRASDKCAWAYVVVHGASWRTVASTAGGCVHLIRLLLRGVRLGFNVFYRAEAFAVKAELWARQRVTSSNPFDHLDDLCLDVVMRHVPNALDLAACRASSTPCARRLAVSCAVACMRIFMSPWMCIRYLSKSSAAAKLSTGRTTALALWTWPPVTLVGMLHCLLGERGVSR